MNDGSALIHINGVEYQLVGQFTDKDSPEFQRLGARVERMVAGIDTQIQHFDVLIDGHVGRLTVRPTVVVSTALVFVPAFEPQVY